MKKGAKSTEAEIKRLAKLDGNKSCCDCAEKLPGYADLTHNVFVCTRCSGIHREFQYKVKGVSMTIFSEDDIAGIASMGNDAFNSIFLARYTGVPITASTDTNKLKEFLRQKYVERKWHRDTGLPPQQSFTPTAAPSFSAFEDPFAEPSLSAAQNVLASQQQSDRISIKINRRGSTGALPEKRRGSKDLVSGVGALSLGAASAFDPFASPAPSATAFDPFAPSAAAPAPQAAQAAPFDPFGAAPAQTQTQAPFDPFSQSAAPAQAAFDPFAAPAAAPAAPHKAQSNVMDLFGAAAPLQAAPFDPFAAPVPAAAAHDPFAPRATQAPPAPLPFISSSQPAPAPAPAPTPAPATKNFSAFDDLLAESLTTSSTSSLSSHAPGQASATNNPFDAFGGGPSPAQPARFPYPPPGHPSTAPAGFPYPQPSAGGGYPQQPAGGGYPQPGHPSAPAGYPQPVGGGYPQQVPAGYPQPPHGGAQPYPYPYGVPPGAQPYAQYPYGAPPQGVPPGYPAGYPPQGYPPQGAPAQPQSAPAAPATPDPFAAMSSIAWNAASGAASAPAAPRPAVPVPAQPQSVNPFDLF